MCAMTARRGAMPACLVRIWWRARCCWKPGPRWAGGTFASIGSPGRAGAQPDADGIAPFAVHARVVATSTAWDPGPRVIVTYVAIDHEGKPRPVPR